MNANFFANYSVLRLLIFITPFLPIKDMDRELSPDIALPAHDMGKVQLSLSFHQKWIASAASDGKLLLRLTENPVSI